MTRLRADIDSVLLVIETEGKTIGGIQKTTDTFMDVALGKTATVGALKLSQASHFSVDRGGIRDSRVLTVTNGDEPVLDVSIRDGKVEEGQPRTYKPEQFSEVLKAHARKLRRRAST
jgi:predicted type IV restriction endonuclease